MPEENVLHSNSRRGIGHIHFSLRFEKPWYEHHYGFSLKANKNWLGHVSFFDTLHKKPLTFSGWPHFAHIFATVR